MQLEGRSTNIGQVDARYKFIGKERDTETGLDWLDARAYDGRIGRFFTVDPLAENPSLRAWSPYDCSFNNPARFKGSNGNEVPMRVMRRGFAIWDGFVQW